MTVKIKAKPTIMRMIAADVPIVGKISNVFIALTVSSGTNAVCSNHTTGK